MSEVNVEFATIKENVRHNEKAIDKLDKDLREFRTEIKEDLKQSTNKLDSELKRSVDRLDKDLKEFRTEIKEDLKAVKKNTDNLVWKLVATLAGSVILELLVNKLF